MTKNMRSIVQRISCILCVLIPVILSGQSGVQEATRFKVLSYTLSFRKQASMEEFAEFIKKEDPDFVALQEVDNRTLRERPPKQNDIDFATELGYHTGMIPAY